MAHSTSKDGTRIAFDKTGTGPAVIIVNGAMGYRAFYGDKPLKVPKLALYEPPYGTDSDKDKQDFADQRRRLNELIKTGNPGDAAAFFMTVLGTPPEALEGLRKSPEWPFMQSVEHTLAYEYAVLGDGAIPVDAAKKATIPALIMNGEKSFDFMGEAAKNLSKVMPNAQWKTLKDQTHLVSPEVLAPVLAGFFKTR